MIKIIKDSLEKREEIFSVSVEKPDVAEIVSGIIERVKTAFDENGIEIPFNQLDVHIKKD